MLAFAGSAVCGSVEAQQISLFGCTKGKWCLRTKLPHFGLSDSLNFVDNTRSCEALCSREHYEQNQDVSLFILRLREIHLIA
jgi:hypothetical protein